MLVGKSESREPAPILRERVLRSTLLAHHLSECGAMPAAILAGIYSILLDTVGMRGAIITACTALVQKH